MSNSIRDTIDSVVSRNGDVLSIAVRGANGELLAGSKDQNDRQVDPAGGKSSATNVQAPLLFGNVQAGRIEMSFRPLVSRNNIFGVSQTMIGFICFIAVAGFFGYYFILRRVLRELDPSRAIPHRVKAAFDTLAEGVLIIDEEERVLLANSAFVKKVAQTEELMLGALAGDLPWVAFDAASAARELPWRGAVRTGKSVLGVPMGIKNPAGQLQRLLVNATRIVDDKGVARGVIATFDDVTAIHEMNEQLNLANHELHVSQLKIFDQNQKLWLLASTDPLTGCLNRRSFFEKAERAFKNAIKQRGLISFIMVDADYFKRVNDRFGHGVGDEVLVGLADILKSSCGARDSVGRYGGEEFCMAVVGRTEDDVVRLAEHIRREVAEVSTVLPNGEKSRSVSELPPKSRTPANWLPIWSSAPTRLCTRRKMRDEIVLSAGRRRRRRKGNLGSNNWHEVPIRIKVRSGLPRDKQDEKFSIRCRSIKFGSSSAHPIWKDARKWDLHDRPRHGPCFTVRLLTG